VVKSMSATTYMSVHGCPTLSPQASFTAEWKLHSLPSLTTHGRCLKPLYLGLYQQVNVWTYSSNPMTTLHQEKRRMSIERHKLPKAMYKWVWRGVKHASVCSANESHDIYYMLWFIYNTYEQISCQTLGFDNPLLP